MTGDRQRRDVGRHRPRRRRHVDDPRRRRRHHAAEPRAARHRRAVRHAGRALSGPHRPRPRPRAGHRSAHARARCGAIPTSADTFPQDVLELQAFLAPAAAGPGDRRPCPAPGTTCRSGSSARASSARSSPPSSACRTPSPRTSRPTRCCRRSRSTASRFKPSAQLDRPYAMVGRQRHRRRDRRRGAPAVHVAAAVVHRTCFAGAAASCQPPIDDIEAYWSPPEKAQASQMLRLLASSARPRRCAPGSTRLLERDRRRRADGRVRRLRPRASGCGRSS